jgi:hypothetical protein
VESDAEEAAVMLAAAGFRYDKNTSCWIHHNQGRAISGRIVAAHDTDWLAHWITAD